MLGAGKAGRGTWEKAPLDNLLEASVLGGSGSWKYRDTPARQAGCLLNEPPLARQAAQAGFFLPDILLEPTPWCHHHLL
jgi:hypothetical protein